MRLQLIRNATMRLEYAGKTFLLDPMLAPAEATKGFVSERRNPLVGLPQPAEEIIANLNAVIVSHLHQDHFDPIAQQMLGKSLPLFCAPVDEPTIEEKGFHHLIPVETAVSWQGITLTRTAARHGYGKMAKRMGHVAGFVLEAKGEPTLYWCGDTVWYEEVATVIAKKRPPLIITHSGGAQFPQGGLILMDDAQTIAVAQAAPNAQIVAIHLEALDHCATSRTTLQTAATEAGVQARLHIPADGEWLTFEEGRSGQNDRQ